MDAPPSPSISECPTAEDETQAPLPSIRESLPEYGISVETAEEWECKYNRQEVRLMRDEDFWRILREIAQASDPADVQSKLKSSIEQESTRLRRDHEHAFSEVLTSGHRLLLTHESKFAFTSSYSPDIKAHSIHAFMAYCVPHLIELAQTSKGKPQKQEKASSGRKREPKAQGQDNKIPRPKQRLLSGKVPKQSSGAGSAGTRRSLRIAKQQMTKR